MESSAPPSPQSVSSHSSLERPAPCSKGSEEQAPPDIVDTELAQAERKGQLGEPLGWAGNLFGSDPQYGIPEPQLTGEASRQTAPVSQDLANFDRLKIFCVVVGDLGSRALAPKVLPTVAADWVVELCSDDDLIRHGPTHLAAVIREGVCRSPVVLLSFITSRGEHSRRQASPRGPRVRRSTPRLR